MDLVHVFELAIAMFLAIIVLHYLAHRVGLPPPVALVTGGALLAFLPGVPTITIDPALVIVLFLPPLLMDSAWVIALGQLRRHKVGIASLAIGAVLFTTIVVALVARLLFPSWPWAACAALGAIVAPPDAVSARADTASGGATIAPSAAHAAHGHDGNSRRVTSATTIVVNSTAPIASEAIPTL